MNLSDFRKENPDYNDMSDADLAAALHAKFYSDIPRADFDKAIGYTAPKPTLREQLRERFSGGMASDKPGFLPGVARGIMDVPDAGAQFVTQGLEKIAPAGSDFEAWARGQRQQVEAINQEREQRMAPEAGDDPTAFRAGRVVGNIAGSAGPARVLPNPVTMPGKIATGAAGGASLSATTQPVLTANTPDEFWAEKAEQVRGGALGGAVAAGVSPLLQRPFQPPSKDVQMLRQGGVTPTGGQILGGGWARNEAKLESLPVVGDTIKSAKTKALNEFNRATINRALDPLGTKLPANVEIGRDAVRFAQQVTGDAYKAVTPKLGLRGMDREFVDDIQAVSKKAVFPQARDALAKLMQDEVMPTLQRARTSGVPLRGEEVEALTKRIGELSRGHASGDSVQKETARLLDGVRESFLDLIARQNPQAAKEFAAVRKATAQLMRVERAATRAGQEDPGVFSPSQFEAAVKALDTSSRRRQSAAGNALMQDWADAGVRVLGPKYPDSGSVGRGAMAYMASNPAGAAPLLAGAALSPFIWGPGGRQLTAGLLADRGPAAAAIRGILDVGAIPAGAALGPQFLP